MTTSPHPEDQAGQAADSTASGGKTVRRWRTLWISDLHLGSSGCKANFLLDFLEYNETQTLYLVGDIIDGWQLRRHWHWPRAHNDVVQKILRMSRNGTRVYFIPGNHDEFARQFLGYAFGDIEIHDEIEHLTADKRRFLVMHGDRFDAVIQHGKWLAYLGDRLYTCAIWINNHYNRFRHRRGLHYWSLSQYLKHKVKNAVTYITDFEEALAGEARRRGMHGIICGHIHKPEMRDIDGILYCNDGDWVESLSALTEDHDGKLALLDWSVHANLHARHPTASHQPVSLPALPSALSRKSKSAGLRTSGKTR
ncbi:UDP-2,3-diacylglucosamine diphosphatase [Pseudomonas sp. S 311-6]|jgi:UDP-2,3-diacylglucosamine pyrophosphatase LpxH|uniref:UDP-2,3-diacylglucosamine pyrophosphatase LpxH n=2 Tax=Kerstersia gyiorum TaxID=206506 RepID=A0A4Q7N066_9BURK|nr:UDP-2,3-diacylglucosamine diphosphatase [Kerstersia gyiorum]AZV94588.1 UDP-2,3-diacylglucosamine hydrolase [Bordetella sp. J329]MCO7638431.1 UDP-2,3-diacylglucosamine diphosphatase [Pseudomonas sp. S 311-6]KAB0542627.1 UDP-2,3-diacylglucosamine diphosphatase [Kerstersia gyiorum]MCH4273270.1 UDP-2,3-diacylglucosamine diphosphatase [Kerstersia gyiorum]MCI1230337.1 UDP-2,3-diacylglucosamine diphosphatase [Kerstersia gyiorum]